MNNDIIATLLRDRTTERNIIWATTEFAAKEITLEDVPLIVPRHEKNREHQKLRTRARAEIFTPPEICNLQNDLLIAPFDKQRLENFIDAKFLEITCGEAPYITSRYNPVTGEPIDIAERVGLLDRKLRVIAENTSAPADRMNFTIRALKSVYGYEFQGDNLFLARRNIFLTVEEFLSRKIDSQKLKEILPQVAEIISWNFWQMDGLTNSPPFSESVNLFGGANCRIKDWRTGKIFEFVELSGGKRR